jgi:hypothetical protein
MSPPVQSLSTQSTTGTAPTVGGELGPATRTLGVGSEVAGGADVSVAVGPVAGADAVRLGEGSGLMAGALEQATSRIATSVIRAAGQTVRMAGSAGRDRDRP